MAITTQDGLVSAMAGAMGGSKSEEFLAPCSTGEDTYVLCQKCGYAANVEAMTTRVEQRDLPTVPEMEILDTPNTPTIETLVDLSNEKFPRSDRAWTAADTLKNVVFKVNNPDGTSYALAVGVPGDREVDMRRSEPTHSRLSVTRTPRKTRRGHALP